MAGIRLAGLTRAFGASRAVDGVSLDIPDGEFVVLVGPSGCGKTTTLNMIAGLEAPTAGDVYIGGERVTDREPRDRQLGMVFQSLALFPHMSVFDNIAFPLRIRKTPPASLSSSTVRPRPSPRTTPSSACAPSTCASATGRAGGRRR